MQRRVLGRSGVQVSEYCLGAMMFGQWGNADHDDSVRIIHRALDAGINFIDTADVYSQGESEEIVGKAIVGRRDDLVIATKFHGVMGEDPNMAGSAVNMARLIALGEGFSELVPPEVPRQLVVPAAVVTKENVADYEQYAFN